MTVAIPLALYVHIPWCEKKCPYCDFNSHQARGDIDEDAYINALLDDLDCDLSRHASDIGSRELSSIFIGGGTPSLFSPESFLKLLQGVKARIPWASDIEITSEANPSSSEASKFAGFREAGVNRLSIGVQSFNPNHLLALGRVHNSKEALNAATAAVKAGINNFNLDLMFGLPQQSLDQAVADLQQAVELAPTHLSCYQLTIEPNTLFHHSPPITPDHDSLWEMQTTLQSLLASHNYEQYEVSAYSQAGKRARHNLNYWQFGDYLGIGAGAHSKITGQNREIQRAWKIKHPTSYLRQGAYLGGLDVVEKDQLSFEFMLNALRLSEGFDLALFEDRTACRLADIQH
ncbi:MAG: putative oxygen-independent coproporphyrinogen III oxidase, partial [Cryomorphaceae bacterium]